MSLIKRLGVIATLGLGIISYANAQSENNKSDTIIVNKEYFVKETKINEDKTVLDEKEYRIEESILYNGEGKIMTEIVLEYGFEEKDLGMPNLPTNIVARKQINKILLSSVSKKHKHDSLDRKVETKITENYSPGKSDVKKRKILYSYNGDDKNPVEILYDNDNNGEFSEGDSRKIYVPQLEQWISEEFPKKD